MKNHANLPGVPFSSSNEIIEFVLMLRIEFKNATPKIIVLCHKDYWQQRYTELEVEPPNSRGAVIMSVFEVYCTDDILKRLRENWRKIFRWRKCGENNPRVIKT